MFRLTAMASLRKVHVVELCLRPAMLLLLHKPVLLMSRSSRVCMIFFIVTLALSMLRLSIPCLRSVLLLCRPSMLIMVCTTLMHLVLPLIIQPLIPLT